MTISGLREAWKVLRGIPFIPWRADLINILFKYLNSLKITINVELLGKYDNFLGKIWCLNRYCFKSTSSENCHVDIYWSPWRFLISNFCFKKETKSKILFLQANKTLNRTIWDFSLISFFNRIFSLLLCSISNLFRYFTSKILQYARCAFCPEKLVAFQCSVLRYNACLLGKRANN